MSLIALLFASQLALSAPPSPAPRPPTETRFGITLEDPDRWLEDQQNPAAREWVQAHAAHARALLDSIPARADVLKDLQRLHTATASSIQNLVLMKGGRLLLLRQPAGADAPKLYLRESFDGEERLVLDPEDWRRRTGKPHAIDYFVPSPDGRLAVVGVSASGSEMASAYVIELATGRQTEAPISRVRFGASWLPDGSGFFYNRENEVAAGQPSSEHQLNSQAYLHRLGTDAERDALVFGNRYDETLGIEAAQLPVVQAAEGSDWLLGFPYSVDSRLTVFVAALSDVKTGKYVWRRLIGPQDEIRATVQRGDELYLLSAATSARSIEKLSLAPGGARVPVVPPGTQPIDGLASSGDALYYLAKRESGVGSVLYRLPWGSKTPQPMELPGLDTLFPYTVQDGAEGLVVGGTGWAKFPDARRIDAQGRVHATTLQPPPRGLDSDGLVATLVEARSHDGTRVPLSIVHAKGLARDGRNPAMLTAYGAYGYSSEPMLLPAYLAWFERGFVRAYCHVRGGGEKGEAWYRAGFQASKPNAWKDLIACAEYLVEHGYTQPAKLAAIGKSAGGIVVGNALVERPDLFGAVVPQVGVLDAVAGALRDPNGPANWPEFGDPNTEAGFTALAAMSAYHKVKDGTVFPAVMLTHGYNDPRVAVWQSAKMAARLQRAGKGGRPVLLNVDYEAGHGMGSSQASVEAQQADLIAFLLWQFGEEGYAPALAAP